MNRTIALRAATLAALLLVLAGCLESKTLLTVQKDGSGTIEQTTYFKEVALGMPNEPKQTPEEKFNMIQKQSAKAAQKMGQGVTLKSVERLPARGEWQGFKTVYAFADINQLQLGPGSDAGPMKVSGRERLRFQFTKGEVAKLSVIMPPVALPQDAAPGEAQDKELNPAMEAMLGAMAEGMLVELQLRVGGKITKTNATYVNRARDSVGLMRQDLGGLFKDQAVMKKLKNLAKANDPKLLQQTLQESDVRKYLKMDLNQRIDIEFE